MGGDFVVHNEDGSSLSRVKSQVLSRFLYTLNHYVRTLQELLVVFLEVQRLPFRRFRGIFRFFSHGIKVAMDDFHLHQIMKFLFFAYLPALYHTRYFLRLRIARLLLSIFSR